MAGTFPTWKMYKTLSFSQGLTLIKAGTGKAYHLNKKGKLVDDENHYYNPSADDQWFVKRQ